MWFSPLKVRQGFRINTLDHRPEIDGLRAIAVLSIVLFHAKIILFGNAWFVGGYIGDDIFLSLAAT